MSNSQALSYCVTCDKPPGECDHTGPRYLEPIVYERLPDGWKVPDHERERWESDKWTSDKITAGPAQPQPDPKPLQQIMTDLEPHTFLSAMIRTLLTDAYDTSPYQTWQLAENIQRRRDHLDNPSGVLIHGLRQIISYE